MATISATMAGPSGTPNTALPSAPATDDKQLTRREFMTYAWGLAVGATARPDRVPDRKERASLVLGLAVGDRRPHDRPTAEILISHPDLISTVCGVAVHGLRDSWHHHLSKGRRESLGHAAAELVLIQINLEILETL